MERQRRSLRKVIFGIAWTLLLVLLLRVYYFPDPQEALGSSQQAQQSSGESSASASSHGGDGGSSAGPPGKTKRRGPFPRLPMPLYTYSDRAPFRPLFELPQPGRWFGDLHKTPATGYLLYPNAWAQWNNHRRQMLDAIAVARALNRVLVVPPMHYGEPPTGVSPGAFEFFDREAVNRLGPVIELGEFLDQHAGHKIRSVVLTPEAWGQQVRDAGMAYFTKWGLDFGPAESAVSYPTKEPYGGVPTTSWWSELYLERFAAEPVLAFTYLFSQNRFYGELKLFAHIRMGMKLRPEFQAAANRVTGMVRAAATHTTAAAGVPKGAFLAAHVRRGDHMTFCKGNQECFPTVAQMIKRIEDTLSRTGMPEGTPVFLAHNAPPNEVHELSQRFNVVTLRPQDDEPLHEIATAKKDKRFYMVVEMLVAAQAEFFISNNWSTLSACIMEERAILLKDPRTTVYWGLKDDRPLWYGREGEKDPESCLCGESDPTLPYDWSALA